MIWKTVKFYKENEICVGKVQRIIGDTYYIKDHSRVYAVKKDDVIRRTISDDFLFLLFGFFLVLFVVSMFIMMIYIKSQEKPVEIKRSDWELCINDARLIYDNINDTVGVNYANGDEPSKEVQNFIKLCIEERNK